MGRETINAMNPDVQAGVLGVMGGVIGTIQAAEALTMTFRKIKIPRNKKCAVCSENPTITELVDYEQPTCSFGA